MKTKLFVALALSLASGLAAQQAQPATPLAVGVEAPDFTLPAATKDGVGKTVSLHDYKGQVIVLAFFFRARTSG